MSRTRMGLVVNGFGWLSCSLIPLAIIALGYRFGYDRVRYDPPLWPVYVVDTLLWIDVGCTALVLWLSRRWCWLAALVAVPLLCLTAVLAVTGGMWIEGTYF
jgi:hypothetical protein